jgi:hypothetical protein
MLVLLLLVLCLAAAFNAYDTRKQRKRLEALIYVQTTLAAIQKSSWARIKADVALLNNLPNITKAEWEGFTTKVNALPSPQEFARLRSLAEQSFDLSFNVIPDSGIRATKVGDQIVTAGINKA